MAVKEGKRLGWVGLRLGFLGGAVGGALSGFLALLAWGLTTMALKTAAGESLWASEPVTPSAYLANVVFNAVFLGPILGGAVGAFGGALVGPWVSRVRATDLRLGRWVGIALLALVGLGLAEGGVVAGLLSLAEGAIVGGLGGWVADSVFSQRCRRTEQRSASDANEAL